MELPVRLPTAAGGKAPPFRSRCVFSPRETKHDSPRTGTVEKITFIPRPSFRAGKRNQPGRTERCVDFSSNGRNPATAGALRIARQRSGATQKISARIAALITRAASGKADRRASSSSRQVFSHCQRCFKTSLLRFKTVKIFLKQTRPQDHGPAKGVT